MYRNHRCQVLFLFIIMLIAGASLRAQVIMSLQLAPTGLVQKNQLWNMVLVNASATPVSVYVRLRLLSVKDNRLLMTGDAHSIILNKGAKQITAAVVAPVQYNYLSAATDHNPDGFINVGNYRVCYTVYRTNDESVDPLAEDCMPLEVQPLSPPILNTPADADTTGIAYPQFTWLPASPAHVFTNQNYDMILVEVLPGQSKGDAIQKNVPVYNESNIKTPFLNYPASAKSLETGRLYAWKVVAKNEDDPVSQTDIWTFSVRRAVNGSASSQNEVYVVLDDELHGIYHVKEDSLHLKYFSYDRRHSSTITVAKPSGLIIYQQDREIVYGDNYITIKLPAALQQGNIYQLRLRSLNGRPHTLNFTIAKK